jgi:hypothetical protein
MRIREFLKAWWSDWLTRMSGPATVPLAVAALTVSSTLYRTLWATLAVLCAGFTSYRVWLKERIALETERAKNQLPVIEAELERVYIDPFETPSLIAFVLATLHNLNAAISTTIKSYELSVRIEGKDYSSGQRSLANYELQLDEAQPLVADAGGLLPGPLPALADRITDSNPLKRGIPITGWLLFVFPDLSLWPFLCPAESVTLTVTDAFGRKYTVTKAPPWRNVGRIVTARISIEALAEQIYSSFKETSAAHPGANIAFHEGEILKQFQETSDRVLKALLQLQNEQRIQRAGVDRWMLVKYEPSRLSRDRRD